MQTFVNLTTRQNADSEILPAEPGRPAHLDCAESAGRDLLIRTPCRNRASALSGIFAAIALLFLSGCQTAAPGHYPKQSVSQTPGALAPGDVLKISFPGAPEMNQLQKVRADGKISLPTLGEMYVSGMRLGDLQKQLSSRYEAQIKNSEVVVSLEFSAIPVYVSGTVRNPGKVVLDRPMTVLEAIMEAGGFGDFAKTKKVVVIRNANGRHATYVLDMSPALRGKPTEVFYLKAYDAIYVP
jgi:polysaccharide export outer membrane protein